MSPDDDEEPDVFPRQGGRNTKQDRDRRCAATLRKSREQALIEAARERLKEIEDSQKPVVDEDEKKPAIHLLQATFSLAHFAAP
jgi:hypothetical protein